MGSPEEQEAMIMVFREQARHADASVRRNRAGWSNREWVDDAERLMGDLHGSVVSLVNGHVNALIQEVRDLREQLVDAQRVTLLEARGDLITYLDSTGDLRNPGIEFAVDWLNDRAREV